MYEKNAHKAFFVISSLFAKKVQLNVFKCIRNSPPENVRSPTNFCTYGCSVSGRITAFGMAPRVLAK